MKHSQEGRVAARNKVSWSPSSSLNVTQAAGHKERWREKTHTQKKKKKKIQNEGQKKVHKAVVTFKKVRIDAENLFF